VLLAEMRAPVIASLNGAVAGAGLSLALACDFAIAADSAQFTLAYVNIGASCDLSGSWSLPRLVGLRKALELALLGERFDAAEALRLGLVNRVVPEDQLDAQVLALAQRLADGPAQSIAQMKRLMRISFEHDLRGQLDAERAAFLRCASTHDFAEGLEAFLARRARSSAPAEPRPRVRRRGFDPAAGRCHNARPTAPRPRLHDHHQPARHRPVQVHDDAGRAAPLSRCAGRVPLQWPQPRHRPDAVRRRDPRADRGAVHAALLRGGTRLPARPALHQERFRRLPRLFQLNTKYITSSRRRPARRDRHRHQGAVAAHDPVRDPGAGDRQRGLLPRPSAAPTSRPAARLLDKIALVRDDPRLAELRIADYGTRRRFSKRWQDEVLLTLKNELDVHSRAPAT